MIYIYIDLENKPILPLLKAYNNVKYIIFYGANQNAKIKSEIGCRIQKIICEKIGNNFLDCKLIDYFSKRIRIKDSEHYIISEDNGYDDWINYYKTAYKANNINRYNSLEEFLYT